MLKKSTLALSLCAISCASVTYGNTEESLLTQEEILSALQEEVFSKTLSKEEILSALEELETGFIADQQEDLPSQDQETPIQPPTPAPKEDHLDSCGISGSPYRASIRHIEGQGIGYNQGYTSLDLFATPPPLLDGLWTPFIDGRVHIFNNGRIATNIGLGLRYKAPTFVYGINSYYDYRETKHQTYNQYAIGFEALSKVFDFRLNGYFPLGATKSSPYNPPKFAYFKGHQMYVSQAEEFAMTGFNAEVGVHFKKMSMMEFYGAFGPYYFGGKGKNAAGGKIRAYGLFLDLIKIEGSLSYDPVFQWIGQGELSFILPFGPKKSISKKRSSCSHDRRLHHRSLQSVDRFEIMVVDHHTIYEPSINPLTGLAHTFFFVNNTTSHSLGTFENPFATLIEAEAASNPYDIIYVEAGDGSSRGMEQGIILQKHQKLLGSGVVHPFLTTAGGISIPKHTHTLPLISNPGSSVLIVSEGCEVGGFHILGGNTPSITNSFLDPYHTPSIFVRDTIISHAESHPEQTQASTLAMIAVNQHMTNPETHITFHDLGQPSLSYDPSPSVETAPYEHGVGRYDEVNVFNSNISQEDIATSTSYTTPPSTDSSKVHSASLSDTVMFWLRALWGSKQKDESEKD